MPRASFGRVLPVLLVGLALLYLWWLRRQLRRRWPAATPGTDEAPTPGPWDAHHTWNQDPRPFVWHKTADEILDAIATYCQPINDSAH
jgi:protein-S-isoprenylcysteine O-methyltransferase Ste14